jgi:hypothetical protein
MRRPRGDGPRSTRLAVQAEHARARVPVRAPLLPHEHDESPETSPLADPVTVQAHADVARGLVDTERRGDAVHVFNRRRRRATKAPRGR